MKKIIYFGSVFIGILLLALIINQRAVAPENNEPPQLLEGLVVLSPEENESISSPLSINGYVNGKDWVAFEAQAGIVRVLDANNQELGFALLKSEEDWMKLPSNFSAKLSFTKSETKTGWLIFKNENPSGMPEKEKEYKLPINFK